MSVLNAIINNLPEVKGPSQKYLSFKTKITWTLIILVSYFILGVIPLHGLGDNALKNFDFLSIILGAQFGSLISLGIGPIVTASIVLQLLMGSGILKIDTSTHEGRVFFQGLQKVSSIFFILFEAAIYVLLGGLSPAAGFSPWYLVFQLCLGGLLIMLMDEVVNKWGIGSGLSLFIAAGVSAEVFIQIFSPLTTTGAFFVGSGQAPVGRILVIFLSLFQGSVESMKTALIAFSEIAATAIVFLLVVYVQAMKVEIPLSFGRIRGYGIRWPLKFIYTSNIPVILVAALMANFQLWARLLESWGRPILGTFSGNTPATGFVTWIFPPNIVRNLFSGTFASIDLAHALTYILFMIIGAVIFSIFWVQTSGMDAASQSRQILNSGLQIPGFRRDERVLEAILKRYITPLTVMGGATVGLLAATADLSGALSRGTGILLTVMIIYKFYEDIAKQHMMDMNPAMKKFMGGS
ncbi:preprotein translocase subunit SecY [Candidatus Woesearchaeota archaeon]|nr:preprotein translocase subunit SecY [Candidatus Woesearchaeota archaeon]